MTTATKTAPAAAAATFEATLAELATKTGQDKADLYNLVRYLVATRKAKKVGVKPVTKTETNPKGVGKGQDIYELPTEITIKLK